MTKSALCAQNAEAQAVNGNRLTAAVVITTKNRKQDLHRAVRSCVEQTARPTVVVIDDGSSDGTDQMIRRDFPTVRFFRHEMSEGYIVQRNRAARLVSEDIIFSIDDDAEFSSPHTVQQTLAEFDDPAIAAVAIPHVNVTHSDAVLGCAPDRNRTFVTFAFSGTAHAVRREAFLAVAGYRQFLVHWGEEEDLCIRMLDLGKFTRLGNADPIYHYQSPVRDFRRMGVYGMRSRLLFFWYNVPMPHLLVHLPAAAANRFVHGIRYGQPLWTTQGLIKGVADCAKELRQRSPVRVDTYRLFRKLRFHAMPLQALKPWAALLPVNGAG